MNNIFIDLITELQKDLINIILIVLPARKIEKMNGENKMLHLVIKEEDNKDIYLLKKDTSKNYGRAVENLLMVVCLETMKNFLSVGKIKKKFMV